jgi:RNA polymerase sigma-70 factor (ECF subfamily)
MIVSGTRASDERGDEHSKSHHDGNEAHRPGVTLVFGDEEEHDETEADGEQEDAGHEQAARHAKLRIVGGVQGFQLGPQVRDGRQVLRIDATLERRDALPLQELDLPLPPDGPNDRDREPAHHAEDRQEQQEHLEIAHVELPSCAASGRPTPPPSRSRSWHLGRGDVAGGFQADAAHSDGPRRVRAGGALLHSAGRVKPDRVLESSNSTMSPPAPRARDENPGADERRWIELARGGDESAFAALVTRHQDRVCALVRRILRSAPDAEEAAQDAFVRAWKALPHFRGDAAFSTWLHRIAVRSAFDRLDRMRTQKRREADLDAARAVASEASELGDAFARRRLEIAIARLPDLQRAAIALFYLQDYSVADVASILGQNENTVKTHLHRARAALRRDWQEEPCS